MCRDEQARWRTAGHWLLQANLGEVSAVMAALQGSGISAPQLLAVATSHGITLPRMAQIVASTTEPTGATGRKAGRSAEAVAVGLRSAAILRDTEVRALQASGVMPEGISRLPAARPDHYDLARVAPEAVATAIDVWESNDIPVSGPGDARPADPLFKTWFKALDALGTRTLTMAEMNAIIQSDGSWQGERGRLRTASHFKLVSDGSTGLISEHELHKFVAGFKGVPGTSNRLVAGAGGESGLFARATAKRADWGHEGGIRAFWAAYPPPSKADAEAFALAYIHDVQWRLTVAPSAGLDVKLNTLAARGYFADPRDRPVLSATLDSLRASAPDSPERVAAASALGDFLRSRWRAADTVSVSGATAEIQMMETMHRYLTNNGLKVSDPSQRIDAVEVYKLYRTLLKNDQLTSRATVETWLKSWGVAHVP